MANYGKTYWGKAWLNALNNIDYSNRLPRGRSYVARGAVLEINRTATKVTASVAGSRRTPYSVTIGIPEFNAGEKEKITNVLTANPAFLAALLNRTLPRDLLDITQKEGIALFPSKWNDLDMHCSCPDWAVPCKHLAAVIYSIANQIDLNPLLVLEMHGYDVEAAMDKEEVDITKDRSEVFTALEDLTEPFPENLSASDQDNAEFNPPAPRPFGAAHGGRSLP